MTFLHDKYKGMLAMGAYGDAIGVFNELAGLNGNHATPYRTTLDNASTIPGRSMSQAFGLWPAISGPNTLPATTKGVVSDDSAYRLTTLHAFLDHALQNNYALLDETAFRQFLNQPAQTSAAAPMGPLQFPSDVDILLARYNVIESFKVMYSDQEKWLSGNVSLPATLLNPPLQTFWEGGASTIFGLFLFLELASIYACCPLSSVYDRFENYSIMDNSPADEALGMYGAMLAAAICTHPVSGGFRDFYFSTIQSLNASNRAKNLQNIVFNGEAVGNAHTDPNPLTFTSGPLTTSYNGRPHQSSSGIDKFSAEIFVEMISAAVAYGRHDPLVMLQVLANGPGDSDTMPTYLGSIIGAYYGYQGIRDSASQASFTADLDAVIATTQTYFLTVVNGNRHGYRVNFDRSATVLEQLQARHPCPA
ncbi:MAG: ADP-ribosylglycohydrolase family protein [Pseudomonadota bacterium]